MRKLETQQSIKIRVLQNTTNPNNDTYFIVKDDNNGKTLHMGQRKYIKPLLKRKFNFYIP